MAVKLTPNLKLQFFDDNGDPLSGGLLFSYSAGSTTKRSTYTSSAGDVANPNPIVLDARGETPDAVWLSEGAEYKFVLAPSYDTDPPAAPIWTEDNVTGVNDTSSSAAQWMLSGVTPVYATAATFTVAGNQTDSFHVGRRLRLQDASVLYASITAVVFSDPATTVTVDLDSGTLSEDLSAVELAVLTATNDSVPRTFALATALDTKVGKTSDTGSAVLPGGTTAERDDPPSGGMIRFNSELGLFEGYNGTAWGSIGGGATGGGSNAVFYENDIHITDDYTITAGRNAMASGPLITDDGVTVTISDGSTLHIL